MAAGILRSKYRSKLKTAKYPYEYFSIFNEFLLYELNVIAYNLRNISCR